MKKLFLMMIFIVFPRAPLMADEIVDPYSLSILHGTLPKDQSIVSNALYKKPYLVETIDLDNNKGIRLLSSVTDYLKDKPEELFFIEGELVYRVGKKFCYRISVFNKDYPLNVLLNLNNKGLSMFKNIRLLEISADIKRKVFQCDDNGSEQINGPSFDINKYFH